MESFIIRFFRCVSKTKGSRRGCLPKHTHKKHLLQAVVFIKPEKKDLTRRFAFSSSAKPQGKLFLCSIEWGCLTIPVDEKYFYIMAAFRNVSMFLPDDPEVADLTRLAITNEAISISENAGDTFLSLTHPKYQTTACVILLLCTHLQYFLTGR